MNCFVLQIVVVDNDHSQLVTCGTVFQGTCQSRTLSNIAVYKTNVIPGRNYGFVASTDPSHPAVAFTAPGPSNSVSLYVGTDDQPTSSLYDPRRYTCGVTRRYLSTDEIFQIKLLTIEGFGPFAYLSKQPATSPDFSVKYVTGFSVGSFSYFLTTQPAVYPPTSSTQRISKLSQVCHDDQYFDSYVEMRISCQSNGKDYSLVQAATVLQPGTRLASRLGLSVTEHLLLASFYDSSDSALCIYRLTDIRQRFTDNIQACYSSSSLLVGRQFFGGNKTCTADSQVSQTHIFSFDSLVIQ